MFNVTKITQVSKFRNLCYRTLLGGRFLSFCITTYYSPLSLRKTTPILKIIVLLINNLLGASAQLAGILCNDVLLVIEGRKIQNFDRLRENIVLDKIAKVINYTINRQGENKIIAVKLKSAS